MGPEVGLLLTCLPVTCAAFREGDHAEKGRPASCTSAGLSCVGMFYILHVHRPYFARRSRNVPRSSLEEQKWGFHLREAGVPGAVRR